VKGVHDISGPVPLPASFDALTAQENK
jgi:hypothetical protein